MSTNSKQIENNNLFSFNNSILKASLKGDFNNIGLKYEAYFNKTIGTYNNTIESHSNTDGINYGFCTNYQPVRKLFKASLKFELKKYETPSCQKTNWINYKINGNLTFKFKHNQSASIKPLLSVGQKVYILNNQIYNINQNSIGLTIDGKIVNRRIFGLFNTSYINVGFLKNKFPIIDSHFNSQTTHSNSFSCLLNQNFVYGRNNIVFNFSYTNVNNSFNDILLNTQLDIDGGIDIKVKDNLSFSTAVIYGFMKSCYSNIGIKGSLSSQVYRYFMVDLSFDLRKNICVFNTSYSRMFNLNCTLKYIMNFKK